MERYLASGREGGLAVSYFVPRYLARIIPVCSVKSESEGTRQFRRGTRRVWPYRQNRVDRVDFSYLKRFSSILVRFQCFLEISYRDERRELKLRNFATIEKGNVFLTRVIFIFRFNKHWTWLNYSCNLRYVKAGKRTVLSYDRAVSTKEMVDARDTRSLLHPHRTNHGQVMTFDN